MLCLILLTMGLVIEFILLPWQILYGLIKSGKFIAILVIIGLISALSGIVSAIFGSMESLLPWILIGVGVLMIYRANRRHPEVREEAFDSFYARHRS